MRWSSGLAVVGVAFVMASACGADRQPLWESDNPVSPLPPPPFGIRARLTDLKEPPTPERVRLGRWLFFDARLSEDKAQSCATCHRPDHGYAEPAPVSTGANGVKTRRNAPGFVNMAWATPPLFYWDGRAETLEGQTMGATEKPVEAGALHQAKPMADAIGALRVYRRYFTEAFGTPDVTAERVAKALADYLRTCTSGDSAWDRWKRGADQKAVSDAVKAGDALFAGKAGCAACHSGDAFTDRRFHNLGVGWQAPNGTFADQGRFAVTSAEGDRGAFRTPPLRDVAASAPYMHDGSLATLRQAVEWHLRGGRKNPGLDPLLKPVSVTNAEVTALVMFLESLTSLRPIDTGPVTFPK